MAQPLPWRRIIAESVAIVASILVAFALDAAWDSHQDRQARQELLVGLHAEAVVNQELARDANSETLASITRLIKFRSGSSNEWSEFDLGQLLDEVYLPLIRDWAALFQTGFLDATITSGKLALISNPDTRAALTDLSAAVAAADRLTLEMDRTGTDAAAVVGEYSRVRQVGGVGVATDRTGLNELRSDRRLLGLASARIVYFGGYLYTLRTEVIPALDTVVELIDRDLTAIGAGSRSN